MKLTSTNPSNYKPTGDIEISTLPEIQSKITAAHAAKQGWKELGVDQRVKLLRQVFDEIAANKDTIARMQAEEMGMPISIALADVDDAYRFATWYFDNANKYLTPETTYETDQELHQVYFEPIGVSAVILPWNFPLANIVWGALQGLIAGNVTIVKHSEECPLFANYVNKLFNQHLPKGVFDMVFGAGEVGRMLVEQDINFIQFTGSTKTGHYLYEQAGKKFIKANMELGGSAPGIIFEDADLDKALPIVCDQRLFHAGQCCDGLKRLIVHESIVNAVITKLKPLFETQVVGDALDPKTQIGPLVAKRQLDLLKAQVQEATTKGAKVITGGQDLEEKLGGAFYSPTILTNVTPDMRVWQEEVFGPVLPIVTFKTEGEAVKLANDTTYGLGSYVYTADKERVKRIASAIEAGMVSVNGLSYIRPENPFGGYKHSGLGREHGKYGFQDVVQIKVVAWEK